VYVRVRARARARVCVCVWSRYGSVGIATGYGLEARMSFPERKRLFSITSRPAPGSIQPPILWVTMAVYLGVKCQKCEADHQVELYVHSPTSLHGVVLN
jgi:hypothetical protein